MTTDKKTSKVTGLSLGNKLCTILGVSNVGVREICISADAQDAAYVIVKRYLTETEADRVAECISEYSLCENESMGDKDE